MSQNLTDLGKIILYLAAYILILVAVAWSSVNLIGETAGVIIVVIALAITTPILGIKLADLAKPRKQNR